LDKNLECLEIKPVLALLSALAGKAKDDSFAHFAVWEIHQFIKVIHYN
jgi:hypothetical protein